MKNISMVCAGGWLIAVLGLAAAPAAAAERGDIEERRGYYVERIAKTLDVGAGGVLELDAQRGKVRVESWSKEQVQVEVEKKADVFTRGEAERLFADFEVDIRAQGQAVEVRGRSRGDRRVRSLELSFVVKVPQRFSVDLETSGGSIEVADLEGAVKAETSGGSIKVGQIKKGPVDVSTSGGSVRIEGIAGGSGSANSSGGSIDVGDVTGDLKLDTSGGSLRVGKVGGKLVAHTSGGSIAIERGGRSVEAETAGGSISISGAAGDVTAETAGGSISIGPAGGDVAAETAGGSISIKEAGGKVRAETAGGSISVGGSGGPVEANTAGGSIAIRGARGYVEAETAGGGIEVELAAVGDGRDMHCYLETSGGDISIALPGGMKATVDAEIEIKDEWSRGEYDIYSDFSLDIKRQKGRRVSAEGDINGGGHLLKLSTTNGDIRIERR